MNTVDIYMPANCEDPSRKRKEAIIQFKYQYYNLYKQVQECLVNKSIQYETNPAVRDFYWMLEFIGALNTDQVKWDITREKVNNVKRIIDNMNQKGPQYVSYIYRYTKDLSVKRWIGYMYEDIVKMSHYAKLDVEFLSKNITQEQNILIEFLNHIDPNKGQYVIDFLNSCDAVISNNHNIQLRYYNANGEKREIKNIPLRNILQIQNSVGVRYLMDISCYQDNSIAVLIDGMADQNLTDQLQKILMWIGDCQSYNYHENIFLRICMMIERGAINYSLVQPYFVENVCIAIQNKVFGTSKIFETLRKDENSQRSRKDYIETLNIARLQQYLLRLQLVQYKFIIADSPDNISSRDISLLPIKVISVQKFVTCKTPITTRNALGKILENGGQLGNKVIYIVDKDTAERAKKDRKVLCDVPKRNVGSTQYLYWLYYYLGKYSSFKEYLNETIYRKLTKVDTSSYLFEE